MPHAFDAAGKADVAKGAVAGGEDLFVGIDDRCPGNAAAVAAQAGFNLVSAGLPPRLQLDKNIVAIEPLVMIVGPAAETEAGAAARAAELYQNAAAGHFGLGERRAPEIVAV